MSLKEEFPEYDIPPLEIDDGWVPVVRRLLEACRRAGVIMKVRQVKEKFGGLRVYADVPDADQRQGFYKFLSVAEAEAESTCEKCGKPGSLRTGSWLKTLCDEHA